ARLPQLRSGVRGGLAASPKFLPARYLQDARSQELAARIAALPEYYLCSAEVSIMAERAEQIAAIAGSQTLVQLGSQLAPSTCLLVDALTCAGTLRELVLFDLDSAVLAAACASWAAEFPVLSITPLAGDLEADLSGISLGDRTLVVMPESTVGTLDPLARWHFLRRLRAVLRPGDLFLLTADLVREPARLRRAHDDEGGLSAQLNRNVLTVLNRRLRADFETEAFRYEAAWLPDQELLEMRLRARTDQVVTIAGADLTVHFAAGEPLRTGIAAKFRAGLLTAELASAGLRLQRLWTDPRRDYCLALSQPAG
ncbi:MAG TPA: L-histidine N(alpha)-methyltransferase, partial [Streptosporangiaceae bacterium]